MPQQPNDHGHTWDPQLDKLRDRLHNILSQADSSASSAHGSYGQQSGRGPQGSQGNGSYGQGGYGSGHNGQGGRGQGQSQGSSLGSALLDEVLDLATGGLDSIARNVASSLGINDEPHGQGGHGGQGGYSGQGGGRGSHGGRGQGRGRQSLGQSIEEWADNFGPEEAMVEDPLMAMGKSEFGSLKKDLVRGLYEGLVPAEIRERIAEDLHRGLGTETRRNGVPPYESHAASSAHQHHSGHPSHGGHSGHAGQGRSDFMGHGSHGGQGHANNVERSRSAAATVAATAPRAAAPSAAMSAQQVQSTSSISSLDREQGPKMLMTSPEVMRARLKAEQAEEHLAELMSLCNSDEYYQLPHAIRVGVIQQIRKARSVLEQAQAAVAEAERRFPPIEVVRKPEPEPVVASEPEPEAYTETAAVTAADAEQQPTEQSQQVQPEQPKPWEEGALLWWKRFKALPLEEQHAQGQPVALQMVLQLQQDLGALEAMHLSAEDCREYMAHLPQPEEIAAIYCDDQLRLALLQLCNSLREELAVMLAQTPKTEQDTPAADATDAAEAAESTEPAAAKTVESAGETSVADTSGGGDTDESNFAEDDDLPWMQGPWGWWTQFKRLSPVAQRQERCDQQVMSLLVQLQEELQFLVVEELSVDERRAAAEHLPRTEEIAGLWCADHLKAALDDVCQNLRAELLAGLEKSKTEPTAQEQDPANVVADAQQAAEKQPATEAQPAAEAATAAEASATASAGAAASAGAGAAASADGAAQAESSAARMCMDAEVRQSDFGPQRVTLLGATGSIGDSTCEVLRQHPERYVVHALAANSNVEKMLALIAEFKPERVAMSNEHAATALRERLAEDPALAALHIEVLEGSRGVVEVAGDGAAEIVVGAIVGSSGLPPVLAALKTGCRVCLANKEALVMSGKLFFDVAQQFGSTVVPVDSEHSAIFQCLPPQEQRRLGSCHLAEVGVKEILLTGSGGPFRDCDLEVLKTVTPKMAINHPVWSMGPKISVDSATMMNKALEFIEARYLFNARADQIKVIIHPQSVIHSMVSYVDGAVLAQMGQPDMKTPIAHALAYPERISAPVQSLDFTQISALTFKEPDPQRYPCLFMGIEASNQGQASTTALNAANEVAVSAFLHEQLSFLGIADVVKHVLDKLSATQAYTLEEIMDVDRQARELATAFVRSRQA